MNKDVANTVMELYYDAMQGQPGADDSYRQLNSTIARLLPDDAEAGVVVLDDTLAVLAVAGARVFTARVVADTGQRPHAVVRCLPLDAAGVAIEVTDNISGQLPDGKEAIMRNWTFSWSDGSVLSFRTALKWSAWDRGHNYGETVALRMAQLLGWDVPEPER